MKTIFFVFESEGSLNDYQGIIRDILYCTYGIRIESCLDQEVDLYEIISDQDSILVFTEFRKPVASGKCRWLIEGLNHKDLVKEIEECMVLV